MKATQLVRLTAILAFSAIVFSACNKAAINTNNANSTSNTNATPNTAGEKTASNTGATGDYSTPTAAFKSFYEAAKSNNVEGIKRSVSSKTLEMMTREAAKENKSLDDSIKDTAKGAPSSFPETRNEKIDGNKAKLEFKDDKMEGWTTATFIKENGEWKLAIADEISAAMDQMDSEKK